MFNEPNIASNFVIMAQGNNSKDKVDRTRFLLSICERSVVWLVEFPA